MTDEPFDDGGTPAWRANRETWANPHPSARTHIRQAPPRIMDRPRPGGPWRRRWTFVHWLLAAIAFGFGLPMLILWGGLLLAFALNI